MIPDRGSIRPESPRGSSQGGTGTTFQEHCGSEGSHRGWHGVSNRCQTNGMKASRPKRTLDGESVRITYYLGDLGTWRHRRLHLITRRSQVQIRPPLRRKPLAFLHVPRVFSRADLMKREVWSASNLRRLGAIVRLGTSAGIVVSDSRCFRSPAGFACLGEIDDDHGLSLRVWCRPAE